MWRLSIFLNLEKRTHFIQKLNGKKFVITFQGIFVFKMYLNDTDGLNWN